MQLINSCSDRLQQEPENKEVQEELLSRRRELADLKRQRLQGEAAVCACHRRPWTRLICNPCLFQAGGVGLEWVPLV